MTQWMLAVVSVVALACGGGEDRSTTASAAEPMASEPAPASAPAPVAEPAPAAAPGGNAPPQDEPTGELRGDQGKGQELYGLYCSTCHGQGGKGDGPAAPKDPPPADHTDPERMGSMTDVDMYQVINKGGAAVGKSPLMASWGPIVGDQGIRDLIAYIRSLSET